MFARVNTVFAVREQALTVPEEALVPQGGRSFVVKVVPGEKPDTLVSQRVAVKTGVRQPGKVEITEGLELGDSVVVAGHQRLQKDGTAVRVVDLSAAAKNPGPAASAPAAAGSAGPAAAAPTAAAPEKPAKTATGQTAAPAMTGPNPCQRG
jgi:membrane fusion protein (multidrug efflux system)